MKEQINNDAYNHPQSEDEINQKVRLNNTEGRKAEQKIAVNPNPAANENPEHKDISAENLGARSGSEITDGEDG
jgi:hypothetical protein